MMTRAISILPLLVTSAAPALAQSDAGPYWGRMHGGWMWWMPFHGFVWLLLVTAVVVGAVLIIRAFWSLGERRGRERSAALDLLDTRYAKGEIEREEYQQRKRDLSEGLR